MNPVSSPNFAFLAQHDQLFVRYAMLAERYVFEDPNSSLIKQRQLAEALARQAAASIGVDHDDFASVLRLLRDRNAITAELADVFHFVRKAGNAAAHEGAGTQADALRTLQLTRKLAIWFHRVFSRDKDFRAGAFVPPPNPEDASKALREELEQLRRQANLRETEAKSEREAAKQEREMRAAAEAQAARAYTDLQAAIELAEETEKKLDAERARFESQLRQTQAAVANNSAAVAEAAIQNAHEASAALELTELETRLIIDQQLRDAGWETDTQLLRYSNGTRPQKHRNLAIAEWPTASGPADYALFAGLRCVGVVEAKRKNKDVSAYLGQAKRYSRDIRVDSPGGPWGEYRIPFLFSTNGRPYLRQIETRSGIWFLDARRPTNHGRALEAWYTPEGLLDELALHREVAQQKLAAEPMDYLPLRDYQERAVRAVEDGLAVERRAMLLAMATGTGKTITCIGLIYRLLKAKRFRRILFLVDRSALGEQAMNAFSTERLEQNQTFAEIYDVKGLGDLTVDRDTKLHTATVQSMVKRLFFSDDPPPVDQYDCIVVDEAHRGYNLDREMTEAELTFRSEEDYISKFRRVLDHFDAVKIGLTATPALHTTEIFGDPVFHYSYRQAVVEGHLIDHEPPMQIRTRLGEDGIHYARGEQMEIFSTRTAAVDLVHAPDDVDFEIEQFNKDVVNENFNRVVCAELARHIEPREPGKTLVFCATDPHADLVVKLLKDAFEKQYGEVEDDAVVKITGAADRPLELIRRYKNERLPSVAVTVDLLTTGIDVPSITNLVFLRRVRSRILYDQMIGRATRPRRDLYGPGQDKEVFRIFDAVRLYEALHDYTEMKPVVQKPNITFGQLVMELQTVKNGDALREIRDQLAAKLQRRRRRLSDALREQVELLAGCTVEELIRNVRRWTPGETAAWFAERPRLADALDQRNESDGLYQIISRHDDEIREVSYGYGDATKPEDYLETFRRFIAGNVNRIPALLLVTKRPRDLTRKDLRELKLVLDEAGYSEAKLRTAYKEMTNQDIAASIIGYVRQSALGDPLIPYEQRVSRAMQRVLASRKWTEPQRKWLERIGRALKADIVIDRDSLNGPAFENFGGFNYVNKVFDGKAEDLLHDINEELWREGA
ncbi:MAG TPA: type I restriction-modification system endonuclease [Thermoanaerobaculia bacterium]|nr:type I restriction-modification system endonuclease [Thermoanaerobaculia bacterium]